MSNTDDMEVDTDHNHGLRVTTYNSDVQEARGTAMTITNQTGFLLEATASTTSARMILPKMACKAITSK
jgi:hypothetical protein